MSDITVRRYHPSEKLAEEFYLIARESFLHGSPWSIKQYEETITRPDLFFLLAERDGQIVGYIGGEMIIDDAEIYTLVVKKAFQKNQIARKLLEQFKLECEENGMEKIFLEVRVSNRIARKFYENNFFELVGIRKNYYSNPIEDAMIMCLTFRKKEENA